jgi:para-aminobenzoate synthetase component 1
MNTDFQSLLSNKYVCVLNGNNTSSSFVATGNADSKTVKSIAEIEKGKNYFGYISYDYKNKIEYLTSCNIDHLNFDELFFFEPIELQHFNTPIHLSSISNTISNAAIEIKQRVSRQEYISTVSKLKEHISKGDIYEINYCIEFYAENAMINPLSVYKKLNQISEAPFSAFLKLNDKYIISSSPERFIQKKGNEIISQPIKGTARRDDEKNADDILKEELKNSLKDKTENVMIVDLVRNDLSKIAKRGTVKVDELFGLYSFKQVHQLISTISSELNEQFDFKDIIHALFPMGSMTGAPKIKTMQLIEQYEKTKRGVYSGALGYIGENGNFDFSVVIRSILYNSKNKYLSFMVGSAITAQSNAEQEYEECLLKAKAMFEVLRDNN